MTEYPVKTYISDNDALVIPEKEAARYLGYGAHPVSETDTEMIRQGIVQVKGVLAGKACYCRYGIEVKGDEIVLPYGTVKSTHLANWIAGCTEAYFFAVLNPAKYIGLTLMDTLIMSPEKSVTALIGIE